MKDSKGNDRLDYQVPYNPADGLDYQAPYNHADDTQAMRERLLVQPYRPPIFRKSVLRCFTISQISHEFLDMAIENFFKDEKRIFKYLSPYTYNEAEKLWYTTVVYEEYPYGY